MISGYLSDSIFRITKKSFIGALSSLALSPIDPYVTTPDFLTVFPITLQLRAECLLISFSQLSFKVLMPQIIKQ